MLRSAKIACRALTKILVVCACIRTSSAGPFSQLIVFGDSLSDVGNVSQVSAGIVPGQYYYQNRFSNGPIHVDALSAGLGLGPVVRSTASGYDFAYGGARTTGTPFPNSLFVRDVDDQVDQFLSRGPADPNALFVVFAGANDLLGGQTNLTIPVNSLAEDLGRLAMAGARHFLVPNLPLLGYTPRYNDNPSDFAEANARTAQFNAAMDAMLNNLIAAKPALSVYRLDVAALFSQAIADPAAFGFTNVTDPAAPGLEPGALSYNTNQIAVNAHEFLFWDEIHPTATTHALLAQHALALFALPGDFNQNGTVDAADYVLWRKTLGQTGVGLAADGNANGQIDNGDYTIWRANFGRAAGSGSGAASVAPGDSAGMNSAAPEPATFAGVLAGVLAMYSCRHPSVP